jgi:hypothetical protein
MTVRPSPLLLPLLIGLASSAGLAAAQEALPDPAPRPSGAADVPEAPETAATPPDDDAALAAELAALRSRVDAQDQELAALREEQELAAVLEAAEEDTEDYEEPVRFYGYLEAGFRYTAVRDDGVLGPFLPSVAPTFALGATRLYLDAQMEEFRGLLEVLLTNVDNGYEDFSLTGYSVSSQHFRNTLAPGPGIGGWQLVNGLAIERAQIDWAAHELFSVRFGLFLTPWGIWNVDHGSPTLISVVPPYFQNYQMYPTHQLGLSISGSTHPLPWSVGYHLAISNGRIMGPATFQSPDWVNVDLTTDKMLSGRIWARMRDGGTTLALGASGYGGASALPDKDFLSLDPLVLEADLSVVLEEWGFGLDVALDVDRFRLRSELTYTQHHFDGERRVVANFAGGPSLYPSGVQYGTYLVVSYRIPVLDIEIEPYLYGELIYWPSSLPPRDGSLLSSAGVNLHFNSRVQLKAQFLWLRFYEEDGLDFGVYARDDVLLTTLRLVMSF